MRSGWILLVAASLAFGCRAADDTVASENTDGSNSSNRGGAGGHAETDRSPDSSARGDTDGAGGMSGNYEDAATCSGEPHTIGEIASGVVAKGTAVTVACAIATTKPLLINKSKATGKCLWGIYVMDPSAPFGTLVVGHGVSAHPLVDGGWGDCPIGTGPIPDDIEPGDTLDIVGRADSFVLGQCNHGPATSPPPQTQITDVCRVVRRGSSSVSPVVITDFSALKSGKRELQGLLVRIENADAERWPDGAAVGPYGVIRLRQGPGLEVHSDLYYAKPGDGPHFTGAKHFRSITAISGLDYCTWVLQPRDKCTDFDPPSEDCPPPDAARP